MKRTIDHCFNEVTPFHFSICEFNVLAHGMALNGDFKYVDENSLDWPVRSLSLLETIRKADTDIICLAECNHYEDFWEPALAKRGYQGYFVAKKDGPAERFGFPPDGVAIFLRLSIFDPAEYTFSLKQEPVQLVLVTRHKKANKSVTVSMSHFKAKPGHEEQRLVQAKTMLEHINYFNTLKLVCGDFNAEPNEACVKYMLEQGFKPSSVNEYTTWKIRQTEVKHTIDYIMYRPEELEPQGSFTIPVNVEDQGLPNVGHGSDHILIATHFKIP